MALSRGSRLGPYEIVSPLGAGGMGEVYRARDTRLGRDVAVKVLPPAFSADRDRLRRFEQEARSAGQLNDATVTAAVRIASRKLEIPACRMIFSDFKDGYGHTLQENLDALGQTGRGYLGWMIFRSGDDRPVRRACQNSSILAATEPGSRVIRICPRRFRERQLQSPGLAAVMIIHEELHSLGLGENPPDSKEITQQVIARCGR
jgi:serine/threonine protein kinase